LGRSQRDARRQLELSGAGDTRIHQGFVLFFVAGVAAEEALSGQFGDLIVD
jgi:hypothetical protein